MRWMEIAWADVGVKEIAGPAAEPRIIAYFRRVGRADVTSDEVPWCAAFTGACLTEAGIKLELPEAERLLARAFLNFGTPIESPRVGAVVVLKRGSDPAAGHVGFVSGWTETHVKVLGGNQGNAVSEKMFLLGDVLGYRWPAAASADDLAAAGSRIVVKAGEGQLNAVKSAAASASAIAVPELGLNKLAAQLSSWQSSLKTIASFLEFAAAKWPYIGAGLGFWYALKLLYGSGLIKGWRVEDANTGAHVGRPTEPEATA